jgi:hypothetical protein
MPWYEKYNAIIWEEFCSKFEHGDVCRGLLHYDQAVAAEMVAQHYKKAGLKKSRADALRSMILNCRG